MTTHPQQEWETGLTLGNWKKKYNGSFPTKIISGHHYIRARNNMDFIEYLLSLARADERAKKAEYRSTFMDGVKEGREKAVEYINEWSIFWNEWKEIKAKQREPDLVIKPDFFDFMQWLSARNLK